MLVIVQVIMVFVLYCTKCVICMKHIQVVLLCHEMMTDEEGNTGKVRKGSWWQVVLLCDDSDGRSEGKCGEGQKG